MLFKNLLAKELYASIPDASLIAKYFKDGLEIGSSQLAVSAMEELMVREEISTISTVLQSASEQDLLRPGTSIVSMIARSLMEYRKDSILCKYGKALSEGEGDEGILEWIKKPETAKMFRDEQQALQEMIRAQEAKIKRAALCTSSSEDWLKETIEEGFQPCGG